MRICESHLLVNQNTSQWSVPSEAPDLLLKPVPLPGSVAPPSKEGCRQRRGGRGVRTGRTESVGGGPGKATQVAVNHPGTGLWQNRRETATRPPAHLPARPPCCFAVNEAPKSSLPSVTLQVTGKAGGKPGRPERQFR